MTEEKQDRTFDPLSAYGSARWCARRLGVPYETFRKKREEFEAGGFPTIDPLTKATLKAAVDKWLENRPGATQSDRPGNPAGQTKVKRHAL